MIFGRIWDAGCSCDRNWETLQMKTFEVRTKVHNYTNDCDRRALIARFVAIRNVRSNNSELTRDRIGPTRPPKDQNKHVTCTNSRPHALICELQTGTNLHKFGPPRRRHPSGGPTRGGGVQIRVGLEPGDMYPTPQKHHIHRKILGDWFSSHYHPFQKNYMHEITIFELFRGLQLQLSGLFRIN